LCGRACSGSPWAQWIARRGGSGWGRAPCTHPARWLRLFGPHALAGLGLPVEPRSGAFGCGPDMRPADHGVAIVRIRRVLGRVDALVVWPRRRPGPGWPAGGGRGSSCRSGCGCRGRRLRLRRPARPGRRPGAGPQRGGRRHWSGGPAAPGRPPGSGRPRAPGARPGRTMPPRGGQPHPPAPVALVGSGLGAVGVGDQPQRGQGPPRLRWVQPAAGPGRPRPRGGWGGRGGRRPAPGGCPGEIAPVVKAWPVPVRGPARAVRTRPAAVPGPMGSRARSQRRWRRRALVGAGGPAGVQGGEVGEPWPSRRSTSPRRTRTGSAQPPSGSPPTAWAASSWSSATTAPVRRARRPNGCSSP
jgi:hypothetical protein